MHQDSSAIQFLRHMVILGAMAMHPAAIAAVQPPPTTPPAEAATASSDAPTMVPAPAAADAPASEATVKVLQALIMEVKGKAKWRPREDAPWQAAKVDDLLDPGAQILTGVGSSVALRVGKNATVLVASVSSIVLPEIVQDGAVLRTRAGLAYGKADFKVDQAGFANDFEVITPTSVISVRGTEYSVGWGAFDGATINSFAGNQLRDVEVNYFNNRQQYQLGGNTQSGDTNQDPAVAALKSTVGRPPPGKGANSAEAQQNAELGFESDQFGTEQQSVQNAPMGDDWFNAFASQNEIDAFFASLQSPVSAPPPLALNPAPQPPAPLPPPPIPPQLLPAPSGDVVSTSRFPLNPRDPRYPRR